MQVSQSADFLTNLSQVKKNPKWSFAGKGPSRRAGETPGPGAYTTAPGDSGNSKMTKQPSFGFGTQQRDIRWGGYAPGPGQYSPADPNIGSSKYGFGTARRGSGNTGMNNPGPGAYTVGGRVGVEGPKYTAGGRRDTGRGAGTPGPGAYQPGTDAMSTMQHTPKWGFGTSPRGIRAGAANPGPGAYNQGATMEGPKYSMGSHRDPAKYLNTPGPGAYGGPYTQFGY